MYFSKLNLVKGYHQVTICCHCSPIPFVRIPLYAVWIEKCLRIFRGLQCIFVYLDNILVASQSRDLHLEHLCVVLDLLVLNGFVLNLEKCSFAQREIDYLGHRITPAGIVPLLGHVNALLLQPHPQDVCGLQKFLGMVNFSFLELLGLSPLPPHWCSVWKSYSPSLVQGITNCLW